MRLFWVDFEVIEPILLVVQAENMAQCIDIVWKWQQETRGAKNWQPKISEITEDRCGVLFEYKY